jgi:hypothetical protein
MSTFTLTRAGSMLATAGLASAAMTLVPAAAMAAADCGAGTEISAGICEVKFDTAGVHTFAAPSGVSKVSAVLVGAGGGSAFGVNNSYAGGGGEVLYIDTVDLSALTDVVVGAGGAAGTPSGSDGGSTTFALVVANGGLAGAPAIGGNSGSGMLGSNFMTVLGAGGGAAEDAVECTGGAGLTASDVASGSSLFPALLGEPEFGIGGGCDLLIGSVGDYNPGHGGDVTSSTSGDDGNDGLVAFRWAGATLPDTGLDVQPWMIGAGVATVAAGALFASGILRTRRQGRHSA